MLPNNDTARTRNTGLIAELRPLANAIQALFQPFARMLARRGVGVRSTTEIIRRAYVAATIDVLHERNLPVTSARLSVFTGLTQREVEQAQHTELAGDGPQEITLSEVGPLLTAWHEDPKYCVGFTGTPMELEFDAPVARPSFTSLARELTPTRRARDVLEILVRAGAARINESSNRIQVLSRALISEPDSLESISRLGLMVKNLAETSYYNSQTPDLAQRRFNRTAIADFSLSPEAEEEFRKHVQVEGQKFLVALDTWLKKQKPVSSNGRRVGVAAFFYVEPRDDASEQVVERPQEPAPPVVNVQDPSAESHVSEDDANPNFIDVLNYKGPTT